MVENTTSSITVERPSGPACLVLDTTTVREGLRRYVSEEARHAAVSTIFIGEGWDAVTAVEAMKNGAVDFLIKPFTDGDLFRAIRTAIDADRARCDDVRYLNLLDSRYGALSRRERQVMVKVVKGRLNKQVAGDLGISEVTVKAHRGRVMRKMSAQSLPDLARMADKLAEIHPLYQDH
jgi:FixJ family two-component response regulator